MAACARRRWRRAAAAARTCCACPRWVLAGAGLVELVVLHVIALAFLGPKVAWPPFALSEVGLIASATS